MKKIPDLLYHYTGPRQLEYILEDGVLKLTPSNLKIDIGGSKTVPMYHNGEYYGYRVSDKYDNYHPVVWLSSNDAAKAECTGLTADKMLCRIVIEAKKKSWKYLKWTDFTDKYHAPIEFVRLLKKADGADWKSWYVCEEPIPASDFLRIEYLNDNGEYSTEKP